MLRIVSVLLLIGVSFGFEAQAEQPSDPTVSQFDPKYPEKYLGKVRAELLLDETTGLLTYMLRCTSDEPVKIHLASLEEAEVEFRIKPDVDEEKVKVDFLEDQVIANAYTPVPYSDWVKMGKTKKRTRTWAEIGKEREKEKALDRVVELKKNEAISQSFYLYDAPWFDALVKKLETKKFKAYRIDPSPFIYTADAEGKPIIDHHVEVWNYEDAHKRKFNVVYYTGGLIFDLARAKKIQALRPAEKKQEQEKK